jgi:DNA-binding SARP family transcriptional activator
MRDEALGTRFLDIKLLGSPKVSMEGRAARFGTKKALALLCYLAAEGGSHPRKELAELLWPKSDRRSARTDLRTTLSRLRKTLGKDALVARGNSEGVDLFVVEGELLGPLAEGRD